MPAIRPSSSAEGIEELPWHGAVFTVVGGIGKTADDGLDVPQGPVDESDGPRGPGQQVSGPGTCPAWVEPGVLALVVDDSPGASSPGGSRSALTHPVIQILFLKAFLSRRGGCDGGEDLLGLRGECLNGPFGSAGAPGRREEKVQGDRADCAQAHGSNQVADIRETAMTCGERENTDHGHLRALIPQALRPADRQGTENQYRQAPGVNTDRRAQPCCQGRAQEHGTQVLNAVTERLVERDLQYQQRGEGREGGHRRRQQPFGQRPGGNRRHDTFRLEQQVVTLGAGRDCPPGTVTDGIRTPAHQRPDAS